MIYGTKGYVDCYRGTIYHLDGTVAWQYPFPKPEDADQTWAVPNAFVQKHIRLVTAIRTGKPINDVEAQVLSTIMGIMGREAAYTDKFVTYEQIMASNQKLGPETYEFGPVYGIVEEAPIPGVSPIIRM